MTDLYEVQVLQYKFYLEAETQETTERKRLNQNGGTCVSNFRREFKKILKCRSGDGSDQAPVYPGSCAHFDSMLFLKSVFTPRNTQGNIELSESTVSQRCQLEDEENTSQSQSYQLTQFEEDQLPEIPQKTQLQKEIDELDNELPNQDRPITPIEIRKKRKAQNNAKSNFERDMLELEKKKVDLFNKADNDHDEDINYFKSLLPHVRLLPPIKKLAFRSALQNLLINSIVEVEKQNQFSVQNTVQQYGSGVSGVPSSYISQVSTVQNGHQFSGQIQHGDLSELLNIPITTNSTIQM